MKKICSYLADNIGQLFTCSRVNEYIRIRTPYLYPDGDVIDLFIEGESEYTITDLGETLRWLRTQSVSQKKSLKQRLLIEDICLNHNVKLYHGMLFTRVKSLEELAEAITRLSQAALRTADLWFTLRTRNIVSITDEVADFFQDKNIGFDKNKKFAGHSGRSWKIDFYTRHRGKNSLISVLTTGSRSAARNSVNSTVTAWHDLRSLKTSKEKMDFISLFDDSIDVWAEEDFKLLEDLSQIAFWSRPDDLIETLKN